jgi:glucose-6-phosphate 1-dehydrogenase
MPAGYRSRGRFPALIIRLRTLDEVIRHLVILGATGDLSRRSLLPAVAQLLADRSLPADFRVTAVGRRDWDDQAYFDWFMAGSRSADLPDAAIGALREAIRYRAADLADPRQLRDLVAPDDDPAVFYLALPPAVFGPAITAMNVAGLPTGSHVVVEKPFGSDLASARELNELLHGFLPEDSVYRIDHFLHKQTVQNILGLRFANRVFEPIWSRDHIEGVEIVWDETLGLEGRAGYYDRTGALLDMIQNHLLQLLSLVAMQRPRSLSPRDLRDRKVEILRTIRRHDLAEVAAQTMRARYTAGTIAGNAIPNYVDEPGVDPSRDTETYAEAEFRIDDPRWEGIPFRLRTGKALGRPRREILIRFRDVHDVVFEEAHLASANALRLTLDPDTITFTLNINGAGDPFDLETIDLNARLAAQEIPAYGRLLLGVLDGDPTFSIRDDEAEEAWRVIEPIAAGWRDGLTPLGEYVAGSAGPHAGSRGRTLADG